LKYHPDKNSDPRAETKYKEITDAYQKIVDGKADEEYGMAGSRGGGGYGGG
jgi:DnaJ-class molecular chaperone